MLSELFTIKILFLIVFFQITYCTSQQYTEYQEKLYDAICSLNANKVETYLSAGADPNHLLNSNDTYLHIAAGLYLDREVSNIHLKITKLLIKYGAKKYLKNDKNQTAFDIAKIHGYKELFALLKF